MSARLLAVFLFFGFLLALPYARAQTADPDVAIVTLVSGPVTLRSANQPDSAPKPFSRVRLNDELVLPSGATVRILYLRNGRAELWNGAAQFRIRDGESEPRSGAPQAINYPNTVRQTITRSPELLRNARLGGVQIRSVGRSNVTLTDIRNTYMQLRKDLPEEDVTPELYLMSATAEYVANSSSR